MNILRIKLIVSATANCPRNRVTLNSNHEDCKAEGSNRGNEEGGGDS